MRTAPRQRPDTLLPVTRRESDVIVIGAGVNGLTTAICLAEASVPVRICTADPPQQTTSAVAGALWGPHLVGMDDRVGPWGTQTRSQLTELAADPAACVRMAAGIGASRLADPPSPDWAVNADEPCQPEQIPAGYRSGWRLRAPVVWMPGYLDYLLARFRRAGGEMSVAAFGTLAEVCSSSQAAVIVNCTGTGAASFVPDGQVTAVSGQIVVVTNPGISDFFVGTGDNPADLTYLFPHEAHVVLGGTEQPGNWNREPDPAVAAGILAACTKIEPRLTEASVLWHRVGLRPARPAVRLEAEQPAPGGPWVVHNYGHGGAGVTLSWGCAREAADLAITALGG
jgi:D-amino-acid oxidase